MRSERWARALAALAWLGLASAGVPQASGQPVLTVRICGSDETVRIPLDRVPSRRDDCPSPCHATCPRKHTDIPQDDPDEF